MIKRSLLFTTVLLSGCALLSPYTITFTTADGSVVDPSRDSLDLVVSQEAYVYISRVECEGKDAYKPLPIVADDEVAKMAYNLSLDLIADVAIGSHCKLEVTAFDESTTQTTKADIEVYVLEKPVVETETEDTEGENNEASVEEEENSETEDSDEMTEEENVDVLEEGESNESSAGETEDDTEAADENPTNSDSTNTDSTSNPDATTDSTS